MIEFFVLNEEHYEAEVEKSKIEFVIGCDGKHYDYIELLDSAHGDEIYNAHYEQQELELDVHEAVEESIEENGFEYEKDFQMGNYTGGYRYFCGGIYTDKAFCFDYIKAVSTGLQKLNQDGIWIYHTTCEILHNPANLDLSMHVAVMVDPSDVGDMAPNEPYYEYRGEFMISGNKCFIKESMSREYRKKLGCPI